jgi:hypothetical protein
LIGVAPVAATRRTDHDLTRRRPRRLDVRRVTPRHARRERDDAECRRENPETKDHSRDVHRSTFLLHHLHRNTAFAPFVLSRGCGDRPTSRATCMPAWWLCSPTKARGRGSCMSRPPGRRPSPATARASCRYGGAWSRLRDRGGRGRVTLRSGFGPPQQFLD